MWYAVRHAAKLKGLRLHDLRHSFASAPAMSGESLLAVRWLLGNKAGRNDRALRPPE